jgi:hypothetical protein
MIKKKGVLEYETIITRITSFTIKLINKNGFIAMSDNNYYIFGGLKQCNPIFNIYILTFLRLPKVFKI